MNLISNSIQQSVYNPIFFCQKAFFKEQKIWIQFIFCDETVKAV